MSTFPVAFISGNKHVKYFRWAQKMPFKKLVKMWAYCVDFNQCYQDHLYWLYIKQCVKLPVSHAFVPLLLTCPLFVTGFHFLSVLRALRNLAFLRTLRAFIFLRAYILFMYMLIKLTQIRTYLWLFIFDIFEFSYLNVYQVFSLL